MTQSKRQKHDIAPAWNILLTLNLLVKVICFISFAGQTPVFSTYQQMLSKPVMLAAQAVKNAADSGNL